ncbi:complement C1q-like protein 3 [Mizuhopecten yessoensis]|uniref:Collagen alpha-2(VIII) chain n=1 Tax=Mizuhopecten yessoensis TaxID=6573 RepID=A0A210QXD4_MIZYE|nr:complement C1q-like protein 3 [Mizuhopecten yessoensis]XP_021347217.1 complement C1q-like protein 3 [Mizuhopecten yessoensis]OWF53417.1 Collagen alpha-2(VIII) chain [Mizuhopecten yessoensis]
MSSSHSQSINSAEVIQTGSGIKADRLKSRGLQDRFILMKTDDTDDTYDTTRQKLAGFEFYARLGQKLEVQEHEQTIIYDVTVTNGGLTYNNKTGIFTCATSGVYVFSWSALVTADHYVETILRSSKSDLGLTYSGGKGYPGSGSQTVVVNLHQGDNVQVKVGSFTPGSILYDIYTTFSGFRLQ